MSNKSYDYLLNVEQGNLVFLKGFNTEFDEIITFTDQNVRPLEIEDWVNLTNIKLITYKHKSCIITQNKKIC